MTLSGILPALVTPYDADGAPSAETTARLVRTLNSEGADGYFVAGSSAECYLLSTDERLAMLDATVSAAEGRPAIFHVAATDHRESLAMTQRAQEHGAAAVCANIPTYFTYSDDSLAAYFKELREHTELPLLAYYIPSQTGRLLTADFFLELAEQDVLHGMKYTSSDLAILSAIRAARPVGSGFTILGGADDVLLGALAMGADGGIGSSYNLICRVYASILAAHRAGDLDAARAHQAAAISLLRHMGGWEFISFLKSVLRSRGLDAGQARHPMSPIDAEQDRALIHTLEAEQNLVDVLISPVD